MNTNDLRALCDRADAYAAQIHFTLFIGGETLTLKLDKKESDKLADNQLRTELMNKLAAADVPASIHWTPMNRLHNFQFERDGNAHKKVCTPVVHPSQKHDGAHIPWRKIAEMVELVIRDRLFDGDAEYHDDCLDCAFEVIEAITGQTCPSLARA